MFQITKKELKMGLNALYNSPQKSDSSLSYIFNLNLLYYEQKKIHIRF